MDSFIPIDDFSDSPAIPDSFNLFENQSNELSFLSVPTQQSQTSVSSYADSDSDTEDIKSMNKGTTKVKIEKFKGHVDDDERLLASEEGKKLSSKERRQLRNKVSARNFRLRRKEYISHLEDLIAKKSDEADSLKSDNERLVMENKRLADTLAALTLSPASSSASYLSPTPEENTFPQADPSFDFSIFDSNAFDVDRTESNQVFQQQITPRLANLLPTFTRKDANPNLVDWPLAYPSDSPSSNQTNPTGNMQVFNTLVPESLAELEKENQQRQEPKTTVTLEVLSSKPDKEDSASTPKNQEGIWEDARKAAEDVYKRLGLALAGLDLNDEVKPFGEN
ncbi:hypothetical protein V1512DRAFT_265726 [Lipomyces arxii]|uniref:uncharacterized protein n=1 Tax=Lipomyces arxii TaxID=56418 RepID=UPI0034CDE4DA